MINTIRCRILRSVDSVIPDNRDGDSFCTSSLVYSWILLTQLRLGERLALRSESVAAAAAAAVETDRVEEPVTVFAREDVADVVIDTLCKVSGDIERDGEVPDTIDDS
jgi:hypothetical protein